MLKTCIILFCALSIQASEVERLFRGGESAAMRGLNEVLLKAAPLDTSVQAFDIILETKGITAARKAQNFIRDYPLDPVSTWMLLVLADYYLVEGKAGTAANLLEKARLRDEVIAHDVYYLQLKSRVEGSLISSPGLKETERNNILVLDLENAKEAAESRGLLSDSGPELPALPIPVIGRPVQISEAPQGKFHLQVGAFSERENTDRITSLFRDRGYPVQIRERNTGDRVIYLVWVGFYPDRNAALLDSEAIERDLSVKSFVVTSP